MLKRMIPAALMLSLVVPVLPVWADVELKPGHQIDEVVVYPDRALITRKAVLQLNPGSYRVVLNGLPKNLQPDSVRAGGAGSAQVLLHGLEVDSVPVGESPSRLLEQAEKKLAELERQDRAQLDSHKIHERQLKLLNQLADEAARGLVNQLANSKAQLTEWSNTLAFLRSRQWEASKGMHEAEQARKKIAEEKKKVQEELNKLKSYRQERAYQVPVSLEVKKGGSFNLLVSYMVPGASWGSTHEARLDAHGQHLSWTTLGTITQRTGEDWNQVSLKLSTARPALGSALPALPEWWLSLERREREPYGRAKMQPPMVPGPVAESRDEAYELEAPGGEVSDEGTAVLLAVPRRVTIPSDGRSHQAPIGNFTASAKSQYKIVPRQAPTAFLDVSLANQAAWPLMPGAVKAFVGSNFVGSGRLQHSVAPKEAFELGMGADDGIRVERERLERKSGERGVLGKMAYVTYRYKVTLTNAKSAPQKITLLEPLPRSTQDGIKVALEAPSGPKPQEEPGRLRWDLVLSPAQKQVVEWGYTVEYPLGMSVSGLE